MTASPPERRGRPLTTPYLLLALAAGALVLVVALILATGGSDDAPTRAEVPASVPDDLEPALRDLHDAVEGSRP